MARWLDTDGKPAELPFRSYHREFPLGDDCHHDSGYRRGTWEVVESRVQNDDLVYPSICLSPRSYGWATPTRHDRATSGLTIDGVELCGLETGFLSDKLPSVVRPAKECPGGSRNGCTWSRSTPIANGPDPNP